MQQTKPSIPTIILASLSISFPLSAASCKREANPTPVAANATNRNAPVLPMPELAPQDRWLALRQENRHGLVMTPERNSQITSHLKAWDHKTVKIASGRDALSADLLDSMIHENQFYLTGVLQLKDLAQSVLEHRKIENPEFAKVIDSDVAALLADEGFQREMKRVLGEKQQDCKENSALLLLSMLLRFNQLKLPTPETKVNLCAGIYFDSKLAPDGIGHAWVELGDNVYDWSIRPEGKMAITPISSTNYVRIAWSEITYRSDSQKADAALKIIRMPEAP